MQYVISRNEAPVNALFPAPCRSALSRKRSRCDPIGACPERRRNRLCNRFSGDGPPMAAPQLQAFHRTFSVAQAIAAAAGSVATQDSRMLRNVSQFRALAPAPTPAIDPTDTWVVETGKPS